MGSISGRSQCLLACLVAKTILVSVLQTFSLAIMAKQGEIKVETKFKTSGGAAIDVHVVAAG